MKRIHRPRNSICDISNDGLPMPWADGIDFQNQLLNVGSNQIIEITANKNFNRIFHYLGNLCRGNWTRSIQ